MVSHDERPDTVFRSGIADGSDEWVTFFDLAAVSRRGLPHDIATDETLLARLPLLFRTIRGQRFDDEKLDALVERIRHS